MKKKQNSLTIDEVKLLLKQITLHNQAVNEINELLDLIEELKEKSNNEIFEKKAFDSLVDDLKGKIRAKEHELAELKWNQIPHEFHFALERLCWREDFPFFDHFQDIRQLL